ncbi:MAG: ABC transporter permease [Erysipelotrichaceae bacterium]|nr:ABC transporter permease [Erysipelotrichaceae bacterium]
MGTLKFSLHMLKTEYKKSVVYTITLMLTIAVTYIFFNIIDNPYLMEDTQMLQSDAITSAIPFSTTLAFVIICFCAFMILFANNFYISRKTKEIAIMTMSGASFLKVTAYLFYQNLVMTIIAMPLGILIGIACSIGVNNIIYQYLETTASIFYIPVEAVSSTIITIIVIIAAQLLNASGYVYRKDIAYLLASETRPRAEDVRLIRMSSHIYWIIYLVTFILLVLTPYDMINGIVYSCLGVFCINGMIKYCFPTWFHKIKEKFFLSNKIWLISLSNLYYSLKSAVTLIAIYGISSCALSMIMILELDSPREMVTSSIGFIVAIVLILTSIIYKYSMEAQTRRMFYYNLYKLGYTYKQLISIIKREVASFYFIVILLPFLFIGTSLILAYIHNYVSLSFLFLIVLSQWISAIIAAIVTYISYKNSVLKVLKEGVRYE